MFQTEVFIAFQMPCRSGWPSGVRGALYAGTCAGASAGSNRTAASTHATRRSFTMPPLAPRRRAGEERAAVGELDVRGAQYLRPITRDVAGDGDTRAGRQVLAAPSAAIQRVGGAEFNGPLGDLSLRVLHVDVQPRVRILEFHFRDGPRHRVRLIKMELRRDRVMRGRRQVRGARDQRSKSHSQQSRLHRAPPFSNAWRSALASTPVMPGYVWYPIFRKCSMLSVLSS